MRIEAPIQKEALGALLKSFLFFWAVPMEPRTDTKIKPFKRFFLLGGGHTDLHTDLGKEKEIIKNTKIMLEC